MYEKALQYFFNTISILFARSACASGRKAEKIKTKTAGAEVRAIFPERDAQKKTA